MEKCEINEEIISKINLEIKDSLFYMPGEKINGKINLSPEIKLNIKSNKLHFILKLIQYEFWDYTDVNIKELKNIYKTEIQSKSIEYSLKEEEIPEKEEKANFGNFSIILIEKEEKDAMISIPFEFEIKEDSNVLPTFQFESNKYFLGIRHLLTVECKEYQSKNYIGLFIGKKKNMNFVNKKEINQNYQVGLGTLNIKMNIPKQTYYFGEEIDIQVKSDSKLLFKKVTKIQQNLYRKIEWVGYVKNSLLDKKEYSNSKFKYNEDEYGIIGKLSLPFMPILLGVSGGMAGTATGGIIGGIGPEETLNKFIMAPLLGIVGGSFGMIGGFFYGVYEQYKIGKDLMKFNEPKKVIHQSFTGNINDDKKNQKDEVKLDINELKENLKKFVFFKNEKIIGFIKFAQDITPPVNGYFFNCSFNFKVEIHMSGMIYNQDKSIKNQIDFYDGKDYINKMKKLLSTN